jgi:hypothetical protein
VLSSATGDASGEASCADAIGSTIMLNNMNMASTLPAQVNRNRIRHTPQIRNSPNPETFDRRSMPDRAAPGQPFRDIRAFPKSPVDYFRCASIQCAHPNEARCDIVPQRQSRV